MLEFSLAEAKKPFFTDSSIEDQINEHLHVLLIVVTVHYFCTL